MKLLKKLQNYLHTLKSCITEDQIDWSCHLKSAPLTSAFKNPEFVRYSCASVCVCVGGRVQGGIWHWKSEWGCKIMWADGGVQYWCYVLGSTFKGVLAWEYKDPEPHGGNRSPDGVNAATEELMLKQKPPSTNLSHTWEKAKWMKSGHEKCKSVCVCFLGIVRTGRCGGSGIRGRLCFEVCCEEGEPSGRPGSSRPLAS